MTFEEIVEQAATWVEAEDWGELVVNGNVVAEGVLKEAGVPELLEENERLHNVVVRWKLSWMEGPEAQELRERAERAEARLAVAERVVEVARRWDAGPGVLVGWEASRWYPQIRKDLREALDAYDQEEE